MAFPRRERNYIRAEVVSNISILTGEPCVSGTRIPAMTIVEELRSGESLGTIFSHYPSLPFDGVEAVVNWAKENGISVKPS
jgi:uncharacterized protein (DUF433 family)